MTIEEESIEWHQFPPGSAARKEKYAQKIEKDRLAAIAKVNEHPEIDLPESADWTEIKDAVYEILRLELQEEEQRPLTLAEALKIDSERKAAQYLKPQARKDS